MKKMNATIGLSNETAWRRRGAAFSYRHASALFPAEAAVLDHLGERLKAARLIDIGIGTGRTTGHVARRAADYTGIDYSPEMVARARTRYPDVRIDVMDARRMPGFGDGEFDIAMFSYNGIDYVDHADRLKILAEVRRVLRPQGMFVFSAHRLGVVVPPAAALTNLRLSLNPAKSLRGVVRYAQGVRHARRMKAREVVMPEYALLNDSAQEYQLLTYYIAPSAQKRQLITAGFAEVRAFAETGVEVDPDAPYPTPNSRDYMVHYVATRV